MKRIHPLLSAAAAVSVNGEGGFASAMPSVSAGSCPEATIYFRCVKPSGS